MTSIDVAPTTTSAPLVGHWIGGAEAGSATGGLFERRSPLDDELVYRLVRGTAEDVDVAVASALSAGAMWRAIRPMERGRQLQRIGRLMSASIEELCALEAADTGRTVEDVRGGIVSAIEFFEYFGGLVNAEHGEVISLGDDYHVYTRREPYGVVGVVTPWNGPLNQAARAVAPALATGNTVVVKPSEFTSSSTVALARLATEAGLPDGVLNVVTGTGAVAGEALVNHAGVSLIAFTGSVVTGRAIGRAASDRVVPVILELGGKSANIVFADADLEAAVASAVRAFTYNAGQICIAGSRILVEKEVAEEFTRLLLNEVASVRPGESMGPIITTSQFEKIQDYFRIAEADGALLRAGGRVATRPGQFIEPTVYSDVTSEMRIYREEVFGPVACIVPFSGEDEAVRMANDSAYGLVAGMWTSNLQRAHRMAGRLEVGQVLVNEFLGEHVEVPFGGQKSSGLGREKGMSALRHYTQEKSVVMRIAAGQ